ncbi:MAG: hypothetical protein KDC05_05225 [Bacteroidales bacterium]|nr:hypothetical protein [Bacteroidales bacterium]
MKNISRFLIFALFVSIMFNTGYAEKSVFGSYKSSESIKSTAAGCLDPSGFRFLNVNNVRARINTGGDMWWNLDNVGQYYIPANTSKTSFFSGSLWIGGEDVNNQLKLAAIRYRNDGTDYYTGPLSLSGDASIDPETCSEWDKFFRISRAEVDEFIQWFNSENKATDFPGYTIPESIINYPAHGNIEKDQSYYMAPFKDVDGNGDYDPSQGDYPYYDITNELCPKNYAGNPDYVPTPTAESEYYINYYGGILVDQVLKGDETLWWVFNDKGNVHRETDGSAIGMEIRAQAFGFTTNDEINNMTFYTYEIINRSTYELTDTYFCPWVDTDLGHAWNDFVGCDVERGLGYCYNGTPVDEGGPEAYGEQPPAVGVDFFQGPYMDPDGYDNPSFNGDGLLGPTFEGGCNIVTSDGQIIEMSYGDDSTGMYLVRSEAINGVNFGNGIVDDERFGMRRFVYHNNTGPQWQTDPSTAPEYYNFLQGIWKDNERMKYGGNAHDTDPGAPECDFMFPGDSDPCNWGTDGLPPTGGLNQNGNYWTEENVGNPPSDRRFMQSAGPFTLKPGAVNYITVGLPWARAISGGPSASVELLRVVDDKCQALFDNCFKVINGPDAPDLTFQELDKELIVYITNDKSSNNFVESYLELDPQIKTPDSLAELGIEYDPYYRFEGYQIFQMKDASVTLSESRYDPSKVRLIAQYDVKNGVGQLVNFEYDQELNANVPVEVAIDADNGVQHAFRISEDAFATSDIALVNHKQYYFSALAYGYNNYKDYEQTDPNALDGQKKPYLAGRRNIKLYTAIPHIPVNGVIVNGEYGTGPVITRLEGNGNGGNELDLTAESEEEIFSKLPAGTILENGDTVKYGHPDYPIIYEPTYKEGYGPLAIKVIDPLNVKAANYILKMDTIIQNVKLFNVTQTPGISAGGDTVSYKIYPGWTLEDTETGQIYRSDTSTLVENEQLFLDLGISISFRPTGKPGPYKVGQVEIPGPTSTDIVPIYTFLEDNNGLINASISYEDSSRRWLSGVPDVDGSGFSINWIRSGTLEDDWFSQANPWDPDEIYEKMIGGTWAPYAMTAFNLATGQDQNNAGPAFGDINNSKTLANALKNLYSVDIVLTPDKSKWTRCPVVEMAPDRLLAEGNASRFSLRRAPSVDKDGNPSGWPQDKSVSTDPNDPNYIKPNGMGWFPGYAINLETGERLNLMFGEDSWLVDENGRDMLFNPTSTIFSNPAGLPVFGGKHYVYVMQSGIYKNTEVKFDFPAYDAGKVLATSLDTLPDATGLTLPYYRIYGSMIYASAMYVGIPLSNPGTEWLSNEVRLKFNVVRPYEKYFTGKPVPENYSNPQNKHYPLYSFSTETIATGYSTEQAYQDDLDLINVVPNPYYAFGVAPGYERNALDTRVKITNIPEKCTVTIYNVSGTLIRQYKVDHTGIGLPRGSTSNEDTDAKTSVDWDLKNHAGIPIAGGVYLIHVEDDKGNERIVKWFGSLRIEDFKQF